MTKILDLKDRIIDEDGNVVYFTNSLIELLYNGEIPSEILVPANEEDVVLFNKFSYENYDNIFYSLPNRLLTHEERKEQWFYPDKYNEINLLDYFFQKAFEKSLNNGLQTLPENVINRINDEIMLYKEKGFEKFLRFCIFFSDRIKENDYVIGVGRGSSVNSFLLYLLDIHLINPLKYNLDIHEFLKE